MAAGRKQTPMKVNEFGLGYLFWFGLVCSGGALFCVFVSFASPYWYKSWSRVHSPIANIGMWEVCLSGWVKPYDPRMNAYVGCWWIHSTYFSDVWDLIMPPWFRAVQALVIFTLLCNIASTALLVIAGFFQLITQKHFGTKEKRFRLHMVIAILLFAAGGLVLITALVFAMKAKDPNWMPRPWLCYFSWSFGFNVISGFFSAFGGISIFIKSTEIRKKEEKGDDNIDRRAGIPLPPIQPRNDIPFYPKEPSEQDSRNGDTASVTPSKHSESFV
ncbi:hypothetical protein FSP39_017190 [Pinctada imbricata]|uniref:Uncharacterized protein n=1 Tax=Pinctada imbricata TaxID=66713 RepID=A0AA88XLW9_PINIB|nr:hypothetical protein FSP39_017190 [Pinctada imbricata]